MSQVILLAYEGWLLYTSFRAQSATVEALCFARIIDLCSTLTHDRECPNCINLCCRVSWYNDSAGVDLTVRLLPELLPFPLHRQLPRR